MFSLSLSLCIQIFVSWVTWVGNFWKVHIHGVLMDSSSSWNFSMMVLLSFSLSSFLCLLLFRVLLLWIVPLSSSSWVVGLFSLTIIILVTLLHWYVHPPPPPSNWECCLLLLENIYMCVFVCVQRNRWRCGTHCLIGSRVRLVFDLWLLQASLAQRNLPRCWMLWRKQSVNVVIGN